MDQRTNLYTNKAEKYAQYRWDYQDEAIQAIIEKAGLSASSVVADVGAGTGILTRHFVGRVRQVYAIEPNHEMLHEARKRLGGLPSCILVENCAEATGLPDESVDLICAAQAIHWFTPEPTQREFRRILKPGGWLAIIWNTNTASPVSAALQSISTPAYGVQTVHAAPAVNLPPETYFGGAPFERLKWSFSYEQTWEAFFGALCSASFVPEETHPLYPHFEQAAREIFQQHSQGDRLMMGGETHLLIGKITGENQ
jgi:SAM-dependent methyltransferase